MVLQRWLIVGFVAYLFGIWAFAERTVERSLDGVRPVVRISDADPLQCALRFGGAAA